MHVTPLLLSPFPIPSSHLLERRDALDLPLFLLELLLLGLGLGHDGALGLDDALDGADGLVLAGLGVGEAGLSVLLAGELAGRGGAGGGEGDDADDGETLEEHLFSVF